MDGTGSEEAVSAALQELLAGRLRSLRKTRRTLQARDTEMHESSWNSHWIFTRPSLDVRLPSPDIRLILTRCSLASA